MISCCSFSDKGGRDHNEDAYTSIAIDHTSGRLYLFAVADGLGGQSAGEIASNLAINELQEIIRRSALSYKKMDLKDMKEIMMKSFQKANEEICFQAMMVPNRYNMGTTLVAALINDKGRGIVCNVGDSRAYLIGYNSIKRITKDHSHVQELLDEGIITEDEIYKHPGKNIVTNNLGLKNVVPDFIEITMDNKFLLLCSDGLTNVLEEHEIIRIVLNPNNKDICKDLINAAKPNSNDNITVIAVKSF